MKKMILLLLVTLGYWTTYGQCNQNNCQNVPIVNANPWSVSHGTPTWGNNSVWLWSYTNTNGQQVGEGVNYSGKNFIQGEQYCISFTLTNTTNTGNNPANNVSMNVMLTQNPLNGNGFVIPPVPNPNQVLMNQNIWNNGNGTQTFTFNFTASGNFNNIWFFPRNPNMPNPQIEVRISNLVICCPPPPPPCPFIENVRLWDNSYENPSGASPNNYTDYTDEECIPIFDTQFQQINIEPSDDGVFMALFIDLNGDGDFCDDGEEYFNDFVVSGGVGVNLVGAIANGDITGGEIVRTVVSDSPITCDAIPECGEAEDYKLCDPCDKFEDVSFTVDLSCSVNGGASISVKDFELYTELDAIHEWYIVSSPNQGAGPYTPVTSTTTTGAGPHVLATDLPIELYYTVFHKVITKDCGELCFAWEVWCNRSQNNVKAAEVDCCLIFEHWPNGPGDPVDFTAAFSIEFPGDTITGVPDVDYSNNPSATHEWYLYTRPEQNSGDFTFVTMQTGDTFSWSPAQGDTHYFLLHRVITDCGEVCFMNYINKFRSANATGDTKASCEICGPIDCDFVDNPNPECETSQPINLVLNGTTLSWDPVPGAVGYVVESTNFWPADGCNCDNPVSIIPIQTTAPTATLPLNQSTCAVVQVRARCADGSLSDASDWICVGGHGGHGGPKGVAHVGITPNPSDGDVTFTLDVNYDTNVVIEVYDFYGNNVKTLTNTMLANNQKSIEWNGAGLLRRGVYLIKIKTNKETLYKKMIVE